MAIRATPASVIPSVESARIRAGVVVADPVAGVYYAVPIAAVDAVVILVEAVVDAAGRHKLVKDTYTVVDAAVLATAKVLGEAITVPDHTVKGFGKALSDSIAPTDRIVVTLVFLRDFVDAIGASDFATVMMEFPRTYADVQAVSDASKWALAKTNADSLGALDIITAKGVAAAKADAVTSLETMVRSYAKPLSEQTVFAESAALAMTKLLTEAAVAGDALTSKQMAKVLVDYFGLNDGADIADGNAWTFEKYVNNVALVADASTLDISMLFADLALPDDSGVLILQGYCDLSYFFSDYVGESRVFL